ncbi:MAG: hypothetical protein SWJ54_06540 [Cyanobacteriota bacterium]|nr:hypothetical protein [Cyanobacteriota bacterium]
MSQGNINIQGGGEGSKISGVAAAGENQSMTGVALGEINGTVTNTINQIPTSSEDDKAELKTLLSQLQAAINNCAELNAEDKEEALEEVKNLAEAGKEPENPTKKKEAKRATRIIKAITDEIPPTTDLIKAVAQLLPAIATLLAL